MTHLFTTYRNARRTQRLGIALYVLLLTVLLVSVVHGLSTLAVL